jgi:hypothetical protein
MKSGDCDEGIRREPPTPSVALKHQALRAIVGEEDTDGGFELADAVDLLTEDEVHKLLLAVVDKETAPLVMEALSTESEYWDGEGDDGLWREYVNWLERELEEARKALARFESYPMSKEP